jgi:ribulose-5-phosphate 4-epimerase/fuculose-1-phosphate aldolase
MGEEYQGVKFSYQATAHSFPYDDRLTSLNHWSWMLGQLGLTPLHAKGAYGNQSYRTTGLSFIITRSGMIPTAELQLENFCLVDRYDHHQNCFYGRGQHNPSSESYLHYCLYQALPHICAIFHGHSELLDHNARFLGIPETSKFHPYGTVALAHSAVELARANAEAFILKSHGFVVLGENINAAGKTTLNYLYRILNKILKNLS